MKKTLLIISMFFLTSCTIERIETIETPSKEVSQSYTIGKINNFYDIEITELLTILKEGTGVIVFAYPESPYSQVAMTILDEIASKYDLEKIYYFDPTEIREENTAEYQEILTILDEYLEKDSEGVKKLSVPNVTVVNEGSIVGNHISTITDEEGNFLTVLTTSQEEELRKIYSSMINKLFMCEGTCD